MSRAGLLLAASALLWIAAAAGGVIYIFRYESQPAPPAAVARTWPDEAGLARNRDGFSLVIAVHPRCPCTRASVSELNKLLLAWDGRVAALALVAKPFAVSDLWSETDVTKRLREIPHLEVVRDFGGARARAFGVSASGHTLLYDRTGQLVFEGGLTAFRGHEGPSLGTAMLRELVAGRSPASASSKVFGCSLHDDYCPLRGTASEGHDHGDDGHV